MVWIAALYFTASPMNGSSSPIWLLAVLQPARAIATETSSTEVMRLEDMAVILFKTRWLRFRHSAGAAPRSDHRRWWRRRRSDRRRYERPTRWRDACVRPAVDQQIGFVRRTNPVG